MLDDHPPAVGNGLVDDLGQLELLVESQLVADVDVKRVPGKGVLGIEVDERRRPDVDPVIVVGQLQSGEEPLDEGRFPGALRPEDADHEIRRGEVFLGQLGRDQVKAVPAARGVIRGVDERFPVNRPLRTGLHHVRPPPRQNIRLKSGACCWAP